MGKRIVTIQVKKLKNGYFKFTPVGGNGEKLNDQYTRRNNCVAAAKEFKKQIAAAVIVDEKGVMII